MQRMTSTDNVCGFQFPDWWKPWPALRNEFIPALRMLAAVAGGSHPPDHQWSVAERKQALRQLATLRRLLRHPRMRTVYTTVMQRARDTSDGYKHTGWKHHGNAQKYKTHEEQVAAYIINIASNAHRLPYTTEKDVREGRAPAGYLRLDRAKGDTRVRASAKFMGLMAVAALGANPGDKMGDWWNRTYMPACGVTDPKLVFHCFRNTFATQADRAGVKDTRIARITGHSVQGSILHKHYIDTPTLRERAADVAAVQYEALPPLTVYEPDTFAEFFQKQGKVQQHRAAKAARAARQSKK